MEKKKIIIITNYFYPENFKINDIAFDLAVKGNDVTVLTGIPNYPGGKFYSGYGFLKKNIEKLNNVNIIRVPQIPRGNGSKFRLALNYISYLIFLTIYSFYISITKKFDLIFVHHVSPIFIAIPAILIKRIQKIKIIFWNLDLWPEAVTHYISSSILKKIVSYILNKIVKFIYKNIDVLLVSSHSFKKHANLMGYKKNIILFPNWAEDIFLKKITENKSNKYFNIMFAGNIGEGQDIENLFNAIKETVSSDKMIRWLIVGDGRMFNWLKLKVKQYKFKKNVILYGSQPLNLMPKFYSKADAMVITLTKGSAYTKTIPAKLQSYMAFKKPILGMIDGEAAKIIDDSECGYCVNSGDYELFSKYIIKMKSIKKSDLKKMGFNASKYYLKFFSKNKTFKKLYNEINSI